MDAKRQDQPKHRQESHTPKGIYCGLLGGPRIPGAFALPSCPSDEGTSVHAGSALPITLAALPSPGLYRCPGHSLNAAMADHLVRPSALLSLRPRWTGWPWQGKSSFSREMPCGFQVRQDSIARQLCIGPDYSESEVEEFEIGNWTIDNTKRAIYVRMILQASGTLTILNVFPSSQICDRYSIREDSIVHGAACE